MNDVLAIELSQLTVRAALVHDGDASRQMRELIGTASTEEQLDAVKLWSTWFGAPRSMPAVVTVDRLVDYEHGIVVSEDGSSTGWSEDRFSHWLGHPVRLASRTDVLALAFAAHASTSQLAPERESASFVFARLARWPQVASVDRGTLLQPARPMPPPDRLRSERGALDDVAHWAPLVDLAASYRADAIVVAEGAEADVTRVISALDRLVFERSWEASPPNVLALDVGRLGALEAASHWPVRGLARRRARAGAVQLGQAQPMGPRIRSK